MEKQTFSRLAGAAILAATLAVFPLGITVSGGGARLAPTASSAYAMQRGADGPMTIDRLESQGYHCVPMDGPYQGYVLCQKKDGPTYLCNYNGCAIVDRITTPVKPGQQIQAPTGNLTTRG
jgi:hypothetical protein